MHRSESIHSPRSLEPHPPDQPYLIGLVGFDLPILVVDDDANERFFTCRALKRLGVPAAAVETAEDGREALQRLGIEVSAETVRRYGGVICDLKMPRLNGDKVVELVRQQPAVASLFFAIFSSSDDEADRARCLAAGATTFVTKPVDFEAFQVAVYNLLGLMVQAGVR